MKIKISNKWVGEETPVFIVAEGGINHNGKVKIAKELVYEAKKAGADAIKFQTFTASDLASPKSKFYNIFKKLELDKTDFEEISDHAKSQGIVFLSTPFSERSVDILTSLKVPAFKIASGDLTHIPLIKYAASKRKPMIISTGMANLKEVQDAIKAIVSERNRQIIIMHSVSSYPTPPSHANLRVICELMKKFPYPVGYSDNGNDSLVPITSVALGAKIIEKHFTINKKLRGPDHSLSTDPREFASLVQKIREVETMLGDGNKKCQMSESENRMAARRSITAVVPIARGTRITREMIQIKRPATGIEPKYILQVVGKKAIKRISVDESIKWNDIK